MRKKILLYTFLTLLLLITIFTFLFQYIMNIQYVENTKLNLKNNNDFIIKVLKDKDIQDKEFFLKENLSNMRITYIDTTGKVLSDSVVDSETMDNHNQRSEVVDARKYGTGSSLRFSLSTGTQRLYFATKLDNGYVIRTSIPTKIISGLEWKYIKYYILIIFLSLLLSFLLSVKLSRIFTKPIDDLEFITSRIAEGELHRRVTNLSKDEIGHLGLTFNNMADKLELTLNEVTDRQNKMEAILKSVDSGIIAVDKDLRVILINPYAKKIFGIDKDIINQQLMDNIRDFEFENIFKQASEEYTEFTILWPEERNLRVKTADIINGTQKIGTVAAVQDITDIKKYENLRAQFVANVTHELKTPLTSIKGFAETLRYTDNDEDKIKFINIINDEAERLTRLINDILTLSKIENNEIVIMKSINVNSTLKEICYIMNKTAQIKNIELELNLSYDPHIIGNKDRFEQMVINLIDNAIKYSEVNSKVTVSSCVDKDYSIISIRDSGVGISKEHLNRIFERFYTADKARSRAEGGTGLGLAIVKHILINFKGKIEVKSTPSKGSTFILKIPLEAKNEL